MQEARGLRERDRLRGALLSSVGHDLRTPLTAITVALQPRFEQADAPYRRSSIRSTPSPGKLDRYIANLLDMARIEAGSIRLHEEPVDLVDVVGAAGSRPWPGRGGGRPARHRPARRSAAGAAGYCACSTHRLLNLHRQCAALFAGARAAFALSEGTTARDLTLSIIDEGPGIPRRGREPFDRFTRIDGSDRKGGAGLGLAIVKGFADAIGNRG